MFNQLFIDGLQVLVLVFFAVFVLKQMKLLFMSYSGSIGKGTWDDETLNLNVNFMIWDSPKTMAKKLAILNQLGEDRKLFKTREEKAIFDKALADKEAEEGQKLKAIKG